MENSGLRLNQPNQLPQTETHLDHRKHPPTIFSDDHLVGESLELVPQLGVLQLHVRSVGGVCVGDILLETVEKMLRNRHREVEISLLYHSQFAVSGLGFLFPDLEQVVVGDF